MSARLCREKCSPTSTASQRASATRASRRRPRGECVAKRRCAATLGEDAMRRFAFTLICTMLMTLGTALPVAGTGLTLVTLRCTNGTNISAQVDEDTLAGLVEAVEGMALYPAGVSCTLLQTPVLVAIGGTASAAPDGGFVVR